MGKKKKRLHKLVCTYRIYFIREERRAEGREPGMRALFRQGRAQPIAIYGARFFFILSSPRFLIKRRDGGISNASHLLGCIALLLLGVLCTPRCLSAPASTASTHTHLVSTRQTQHYIGGAACRHGYGTLDVDPIGHRSTRRDRDDVQMIGNNNRQN